MYNRFWPLLLVITPITLAVGLMIAAVTTYLMPKQYETFAVIEIKPLPHEFKLLAESPTLAAEAYRTTIAAAHQRLNSEAFFDKVSQKLDLPSRWGVNAQASSRRLGEIIRVDQISGTDLFRVRARHTNREVAMDIIRTLLDVFAAEMKEKWEQSDKQVEKRELRAHVESQEQVVIKLRQELQLEVDRTQSPEAGSDLQQRFDHEVRRLQEMRLKLIGETLGGPDYQGIIVHDEPLIPEHPISPDVRLNLILCAVIGLLAGPIIAFGIMWVRKPVAAGL